MTFTRIAAGCGIAATVIATAGCANGAQSGEATTTTTAAGTSARAELKTVDGTTIGTATVDFSDDVATITVETTPQQVLAPGFHTVAIHADGTCSGDFTSAGEILRGSGRDATPATGELPDLLVRPDGAAKLVTTSAAFTAEDLRGTRGSALIVGGDAQTRAACGVLASPASTTSSSTSSSTSSPASTSTSTSTVTQTVAPPATSTTSSAPSSTATPSTSTSTSSGSSTVTVTVPSIPSTLPSLPANPFDPNGAG